MKKIVFLWLFLAYTHLSKGQDFEIIPEGQPLEPISTTSNKMNIKTTVPKIWAVVIGISEYENPSIIQPKYADSDALLFADFLKSSKGGSISPERLTILTDKKATRSKILEAFHKTCNQATENDVIIIYFASLGQPKLTDNKFFLLTYDSEFTNLEGSAIPFSDINTIINQCKAEDKLIITDVSHSGMINGNSLNNRDALLEKSHKDINNPDTCRIAFLLGCSAMENAHEDSKLGGGQGIFTHFLVEALNGKGDANKNGLVTLRELYEYVYIHVADYTNGMQHPELKGKFDNSLPLGIVK